MVDIMIIALLNVSSNTFAYSIHYFSAETLYSIEASKILACRPGEAEIDEAAALDVELFS